MKFLQKRQNEKSFTKSDYVVLSYEQLLQVNGAPLCQYSCRVIFEKSC